MRKWIDLFESKATPQIIKRAAKGDWPEILHGEEIIQMIVFIESQALAGTAEALRDFEIFWEEAQEDETWTHLLDDGHQVAHLREIEIASIDLPEHGVADPEVAADYAKLTSKAPPVLIVGSSLQDGNHRVEAAIQRGETHILAYVVT